MTKNQKNFLMDGKRKLVLLFAKVKMIPMHKQIYADEAGFFPNDAHNFGRSRVGKRLFRKRKRRGRKYTLHTYGKENIVLHWELRGNNANDSQVCTVMNSVTKKLEKDDILLWDRLGKSGRCKNPKSQHYNPKVVESVRRCGADVWYLPPKGKYFNPMELLFNDLKSYYIRPAYGRNYKELSKYQLARIIGKYMREVASHKLPGFFRARANGRDAERLKLF